MIASCALGSAARDRLELRYPNCESGGSDGDAAKANGVVEGGIGERSDA